MKIASFISLLILCLFIPDTSYGQCYGDYWSNSTEHMNTKHSNLYKRMISQSNLILAKRVETIPKEIQKLFPGKVITVFTIDLDSDNKEDFIVHETDKYNTCFVDSGFNIKHCEKLGCGDGFAFYYFMNLDDDPMLELFSFVGDSEWSDYELIKFNKESWEPKALFKIDPYIKPLGKEEDPLYWGYPWDIVSLVTHKKDNKIYLKSRTWELEKTRSWQEDDPEYIPSYERHYGPSVLFNGVPTQGVGKYNTEDEFKEKTLDEIIKEYEALLPR